MPKTIDPVELLKKQKEYEKFVNSRVPKPNILFNLFKAFVVGGGICVVGQVVLNFFMGYKEGMDIKAATAPTLAVMIFLGSFFTAISLYHNLGEFAGAGAAVPITGFSNTISSAAMEFKREGYILGMGSKMFIIAGPVLVYGILSGIIVAAIKWLVS